MMKQEPLKNRYNFPAKVGLALMGPRNIVCNNDRKKTNPDVTVLGGDENYLELNGYKIAYGRNFTETEVEIRQKYLFARKWCGPKTIS